MRWLRDTMSYRVPVEICFGDKNELWQDGLLVGQWNPHDFIGLTIENGKLSNFRVIPHDDVITSDADQVEWDKVQDAARLVMEDGDSIDTDKIKEG